MDSWNKKKVLITGGSGFIGSFLTEELLRKKAVVSITLFEKNTKIPARVQSFRGDLMSVDFALKATRGMDTVFHLAALKRNGPTHKKEAARFLRQNTTLNLNVLEACRQNGVKNLLLMSSVVANDPGEDGYAWSKKFLEVAGKFYCSQYGMNIIVARAGNAFGPGDNFDLQTAQIVPTLIRRIVAHEDPLNLFGTGNEKRNFVYVEDVVTAMFKLFKNHKGSEPVNLASKEEISIKELVSLILQLERFSPRVQFAEKINKKTATKNLGKVPGDRFKDLRGGLRKTIAWYKEHRNELIIS